MKIGSYPNPFFPFFIFEIKPSTLPTLVIDFPLGQKIVNEQTNRAFIFFVFQLLSFLKSSL